MDKIFIPANLAEIDPDEGINNAIQKLTHALAQQDSGEWQDIELVGGESYPNWYILGHRLETDKEYEYRKKWEVETKERDRVREENMLLREREEYERLKKKFEKDNPTC